MCSCEIGIINLQEQRVHVFRLLTANAYYIMGHFLPFLLRGSTPHLSPKFEFIVTSDTCTTHAGYIIQFVDRVQELYPRN